MKEVYGGYCCPHCGERQTNMIRKAFKPVYHCMRCGRETPTQNLRMVTVQVNPSHWSNKECGVIMNPDKMSYDGIPGDCVFDHRRDTRINTKTGRATGHQPLKAYKRG
jgi:DNA-directed RNA polymerase subunit RPC12/RpoP